MDHDVIIAIGTPAWNDLIEKMNPKATVIRTGAPCSGRRIMPEQLKIQGGLVDKVDLLTLGQIRQWVTETVQLRLGSPAAFQAGRALLAEHDLLLGGS